MSHWPRPRVAQVLQIPRLRHTQRSVFASRIVPGQLEQTMSLVDGCYCLKTPKNTSSVCSDRPRTKFLKLSEGFTSSYSAFVTHISLKKYQSNGPVAYRGIVYNRLYRCPAWRVYLNCLGSAFTAAAALKHRARRSSSA